MPKMTPGNRLYLYQLLSRTVGVGRQTLLPRVEEKLAADGLEPQDLGCSDMRALCEALPEFIKLTVFKKGYVYATVIANEEYDRALAQKEPSAADRAASKGKPWKRKRGTKALKPVKPRHVDRTEPEEQAATKPEPEPKTKPAHEPTPEPEDRPVAEPEPAPEPPAPEGEKDVEAEAEAADAAEPEPDAAEDAATSGPAAEPEPASEPEPRPAPAPEPEHVPPITFTITYVPEPPADAQPEPEPPAPAAEPAGDVAPAADQQAPTARVSARPQADLPQDFHREVRCSSEQLSVLYQVLPADVDPMATLEEDFRAARSTGALGGTRSNVTFALRYLQADGVTPVRVTLRRSARPVAGKRWALTEVDAGAADEVGLEGLDVAPRGPWAAFGHGSDAPDPERSFVQTVSLGSREEALEQLAQLVRPEDWGEGRSVLSYYLTMTFARIQAEGKLAVSEDGRSAHFDTGLVTAEGEPVFARLVTGAGDIPWQLEGFSTSGSAEPASYVTSLAQAVFDRAVSSPAFPSRAAVLRNPRLATPAYDPVANQVRLLVPDDGRALALAVTEGGYQAVATLELRDAYTCARVVSSEQPGWLSAAI